MIQALIDELRKGGFEYNFQKSEDGHFRRVFFAHPRSVVLTQKVLKCFHFGLHQ